MPDISSFTNATKLLSVRGRFFLRESAEHSPVLGIVPFELLGKESKQFARFGKQAAVRVSLYQVILLESP